MSALCRWLFGIRKAELVSLQAGDTLLFSFGEVRDEKGFQEMADGLRKRLDLPESVKIVCVSQDPKITVVRRPIQQLA